MDLVGWLVVDVFSLLVLLIVMFVEQQANLSPDLKRQFLYLYLRLDLNSVNN